MSLSPADDDRIHPAIKGRAFGTAISAAILVFFGFYVHYGANPLESDPAWAKLCSRGVYYTMRIGGGVMVLTFLFYLTGKLRALLFDAFASAGVGLLLLAAGVLLVREYQMDGFILIIVGAMFAHNGYRNWREYQAFIAHRSVSHEVTPPIASAAAPPPVEPVSPPPASPVVDEQPVPEVAAPDPQPTDTVEEPPEEGYLASFSKKRDYHA